MVILHDQKEYFASCGISYYGSFFNEIFATHPDSKIIQTILFMILAGYLIIKDKKFFFSEELTLLNQKYVANVWTAEIRLDETDQLTIESSWKRITENAL